MECLFSEFLRIARHSGFNSLPKGEYPGRDSETGEPLCLMIKEPLHTS